MKEYIDFLENKIVVAESFGFEPFPKIGNILPHAETITQWAIEGGRRAIFASFGLTKTAMQLELAYQVIKKTNKPFLIVMPLGVVGEFKRDNEQFFNNALEAVYITDSDDIENYEPKIYLTNYERIRKGDIDASKFGGVSFDEASILRNLKTETTNYVLGHFKKVPYRFVATATPTPNDFIEILNYADYLGVIDRGHALTRFFQRDSTKAGHLTLYENKKDEFWKWVSTWAVFINKPSDLGFDDTGYDLPKMHLHEIEVYNPDEGPVINKKGDLVLFKDLTKSLPDVSREKSDSVQLRADKTFEIVSEKPDENWILWHHREVERTAIEKKFKDFDLKSVYGSQSNQLKEKLLIDFSEGEYQILSSKAVIAGSGCNFQHACHNMVFVGIDYKFNDFIQAIHRVFRFRQAHEVNVYIIFTQNEHEVLKTLKSKWKNHVELQSEMINIVRKYGLNSDKIKADMKRQLFSKVRSANIGGAEVYNNDATLQWAKRESNSIGLNLSSWPFGDHYEYSDNYNDFGHNHGAEEFFKQCDFLTPELYRTLMPGRIMAVHVKDRIRYSYQNGTSFTTISDFSGQTVQHCEKHGFHLAGKITVTTDVVRENNQTYRLTWGEQCKDGTKMGVGLPEYVLLFRKPPSNSDNAYADNPVEKKRGYYLHECPNCNHKSKNKEDFKSDEGEIIKQIGYEAYDCGGADSICPSCDQAIKLGGFRVDDEYGLPNWQLDAHAYWKSSGDRFLRGDELAKFDMKRVFNAWKKFDKENIYNFQEHLRVCNDLDKAGRLSKLFMTIPPTSSTDMVWTDINRMKTLNANQVNRKAEKHICPLQLDIIERLINRFSNKGDVVGDPFGGLFSTAYKSLEMGRKAFSTELKPEYYDDGLFYLKAIEYKLSVPTLFDLAEA